MYKDMHKWMFISVLFVVAKKKKKKKGNTVHFH